MEENKSSIGGIIGTIVIIAIIILGALYFWGKRIEESRNTQSLVTDTVQPAVETISEAAAIKSIGSGDDLGSIEADLNNTNTENLGIEL